MGFFIHKRPDREGIGSSAFSFLSDSRNYPLKSRSFAWSVLFHLAVIAVLMLQKSPTEFTSRPIYDSIIRPQEDKIVWRHLSVKLPDIDSSTKRVKQAP